MCILLIGCLRDGLLKYLRLCWGVVSWVDLFKCGYLIIRMRCVKWKS